MANFMKKAFTNEKWSKVADEYERTAEHFITHYANDALRIAHERILDVARKSESLTVVDVGCGTGALCLAFAEKYLAPTSSGDATSLKDAKIIATDLADGMLARIDEKLNSRPRYQHFRSQIETTQMDGQLLDKLEDASVNIIGSSFGLSIFPDRVKAWGSCTRVLKDGGVLFATVWDTQSANLRWIDGCARLAHEAQLTKASDSGDAASPPLFLPSMKVGQASIISELRAAGFRDVEMYRVCHSIVCESPSAFVGPMLDNPGFSSFAEAAGRERLEDFLYQSIADEGTFAVDSDQPTPLSVAEVKKSTRPVVIEFIAHVVVANK